MSRKRSSIISLSRRVSNNSANNVVVEAIEARRLSVQKRLSKRRNRKSSVASNSTSLSGSLANRNQTALETNATAGLPPIITKEEAESLASDDVFIQASEDIDDKSISFTIWDYGGQDVFYPLHHIFLSKYGIYTVVFSLVSFLEDEVRTVEYIQFWLNSIKIHAPAAPVFIVGTFLDKVQNQHKSVGRVNKVVQKVISRFPQVIHNQKEELVFFPITNTESESVRFFRSSVEKAARAQRFVKKKVDLRWVGFLEKLLNLTFEDKFFLSHKKASKLAKETGITTRDEVQEVLQFFHQHGLLVYLDATLNLAKVVTLNPQWLVDRISQVIRDTTLHGLDDDTLEVTGLKLDAERLATKGIISRDLLEQFWHKSHFDFLLDLMKQTMLISEYKFGNEKDYLVPSMIKQKCGEFECEKYRLAVDFKSSFLPKGMFERVLCLFVDFMAEKGHKSEPLLFVDQCKFEDKDLTIVLKKTEMRIEISCSSGSTCSGIRERVKVILKKVNEEIFQDNLLFQILLSAAGERELVEVEKALEVKLEPWFATESEESPKRRLDLDTFLDV